LRRKGGTHIGTAQSVKGGVLWKKKKGPRLRKKRLKLKTAKRDPSLKRKLIQKVDKKFQKFSQMSGKR